MKRTTLAALVALAAAGNAGSAAAQTTDSLLHVSASSTLRFRVNNDGGMAAVGTWDGNESSVGAGGVPVEGAGSRVMWYGGKAAFRAGNVGSFGSTYWDLANLGFGSTAFGQNTRASGNYSFAANLTTTASGDESVALGNNGTASADRAFAFNGTASGVGAVAIGSGAQATSDDALALGPSSIAGGLASITIGPSIANGNFGVAIGLQNSASGQFSVAIGKNARTANRQGSIVLGDACASFSSDSVYATANNQFVARGCGGVKFFTNQGLTSGVELAAGGSGWSAVSDRNRKENFLALEGEDVLARLRRVPVSSWNYIAQDRSIRHMGPMAQDFYAAFGLGENELMINSVDIDGVNMAAIQALTTRTDALQAENATLRQENADLRARVERIEAILTAQAVPRQ
jgi:hypothetical protein